MTRDRGSETIESGLGGDSGVQHDRKGPFSRTTLITAQDDEGDLDE
ncbi:MAG: hypothetical protein KA129_08325 [Microthrixaceae bacterium]|nr:hypothetical protein [Microthrixaceae bacterium]